MTMMSPALASRRSLPTVQAAASFLYHDYLVAVTATQGHGPSRRSGDEENGVADTVVFTNELVR
jgi:hypothetical protein